MREQRASCSNIMARIMRNDVVTVTRAGILWATVKGYEHEWHCRPEACHQEKRCREFFARATLCCIEGWHSRE